MNTSKSPGSSMRSQGETMRKRIGGCNCGQVRFEVSGEPLRIGLCHCLVCRKETGSLGNFFAVWTSDHVSVTGETGSWRLTTDNRHFCATCGSSVFALIDGANEIEVRVGAFDDARPRTSRRLMNYGRLDASAGSIQLTAQSSMWATGPDDRRTRRQPAFALYRA
jgi:hypothetical protein